VARVSTRSFLFFRLSPAEQINALCFGVEQGKAKKRFSVEFYQPIYQIFDIRLENSKFTCRSLAEICSLISDGTHHTPKYISDDQQGIHFISVKDVREWEISFEKTKFISKEEHNKLAKRCSPKTNDILLTKIGTIGKAALVPSNAPIFDIFVSVALLKLNDDSISPPFVTYFLNSEVARIQFSRVVKGIGVPDLHLEDIAAIKIPLPPLNKQIELVAAMDEERSHRKQKSAEADALLDGSDTEILNILGLNVPTLSPRNIFATRLSDLNQSRRIDVSYHLPFHQTITRVLNSCPYPLSTISELCCKPVGGATPKKGDQELYTDSGIKFLRILNIKANEIDLTDVKYIKPDVHEGQLKRSQLDSGDVLMTITGRVGTAAVVNENILPANINQHIVRLKMLNDSCLPEYLAAYLNTNLGLTISNRSVTGGTRMALDYGAIQAIPIPLPPKKIQEQVIAVVQHRRSEAQRLRSEAETGWQIAKQWFEYQLLGGS
jgi:type I restriction enzyme S subunit